MIPKIVSSLTSELNRGNVMSLMPGTVFQGDLGDQGSKGLSGLKVR